MQVPFESLRRTTRERKYAIDDVQASVQRINSAAQDSSLSAKDAIAMINDIEMQLRSLLKRKLRVVEDTEREDLRRCKARLEFLHKLGPPPKNGYIKWMQSRLDRLLVDYMLRCGLHESAEILAKDSRLEDLVDIHIFAGARGALEALKNYNCTLALEWCKNHQARLRKVKSPLEFKLRIQEFIELIRLEHLEEAVMYARDHVAEWAVDYLEDVQHAAGALAFRATTECPRYKNLFHDQRWHELADLFLSELQRISGLPSQPELIVHLQAGLSALKTPHSFRENCTRQDPLHLPAFQKLAEHLPSAKHVHSKLVCSLSDTLMDEDNPPMAFPNGYVYGAKALRELAERNDGKVKCPQTGLVCSFGDLRRVFTAA